MPKCLVMPKGRLRRSSSAIQHVRRFLGSRIVPPAHNGALLLCSRLFGLEVRQFLGLLVSVFEALSIYMAQCRVETTTCVDMANLMLCP